MVLEPLWRGRCAWCAHLGKVAIARTNDRGTSIGSIDDKRILDRPGVSWSASRLERALTSPSDKVYLPAIEALTEIGAPAVPRLSELFLEGGWLVRVRAAEALASIGEPAAEAVPALIVGLSEKDVVLRQTAARALARIGEPAVEALIQALESDGPAPKAAASALERIDSPEARQAINRLNSDGAQD